MASYARTAPSTKNQLSVLAQAKPAIISVSSNNNNSSYKISTGVLSEKINSALRFSSSSLEKAEIKDGFKLNCYEHQKSISRHIEDESVIQKQNTSNQMRQAAVMAAMASQQKVRLSATERLALTAKKSAPQLNGTDQSARQSLTSNVSHPNLYHPAPQVPVAAPSNLAPQVPSSKPKTVPMPTLETLLAVQRQLHQHTRKNLNEVPQQVVSNKNGLSISNNNNINVSQFNKQFDTLEDLTSSSSATNLTLTTASLTTRTMTSQQRGNKPLPPSPPKSPPLSGQSRQQANIHVAPTFVEMPYDKDLPPLPASISPSTTTDESQMNSLDSQSSPATSLVSIPPPPPPISSYLEQYDEVNNSCQQTSSSSSTPSTTISSSVEMLPSSVKQSFFPPIPPVKSLNSKRSSSASTSSFDLPPPPTSYNNNNTTGNTAILPVHCYEQKKQSTSLAPCLAQKPHLFQQQEQLNQYQPNQTPPAAALTTTSSEQMNNVNKFCQNNHIEQRLTQQQPSISIQNQQQFPVSAQLKFSAQNVTSSKLQSHFNANINNNNTNYLTNQLSAANHKSHQINYQDHLFTPSSCGSPNLLPPPPPPLTNDCNPAGGFDEFDSGSFRFPTPPLPDPLLESIDNEGEYDKKGDNDDDDDDEDDDEDDDDDFQCKIPTPPPHKSMSTASFLDLHCHQLQQQQKVKQPSPMFNSSTFSVPISGDGEGNSPIQPPLLFRQQQQQQPQHHQVQTQQAPVSGSQQTVGNSKQPSQLTVHINNEPASGLLSTAANQVSGMGHLAHNGANQHNNHHHHHIMMSMTAISSSSPSSSSDGDGQSSNASSSTSGIHSSIDSSSSSSTNSKLDDFNYSAVKLLRKQQQLLTETALPSTTNREPVIITTSSQHTKQQPPFKNVPVTVSNTAAVPTTTTTTTNSIRRPALKQKKSVSFSDKVELVACAEEQSEDHLPNPLLARVLAQKLQ